MYLHLKIKEKLSFYLYDYLDRQFEDFVPRCLIATTKNSMNNNFFDLFQTHCRQHEPIKI